MSAPTPREEGLSAKVNMAEAAEWIAKRRELLAEFLKSYRGKRHDSTGLSILAMSDLPRALDALEAEGSMAYRIGAPFPRNHLYLRVCLAPCS